MDVLVDDEGFVRPGASLSFTDLRERPGVVGSWWGRWRRFVSVGLLFFVNLCNYSDRFTVAGLLPDVQKTFNVSDSSAGLLQSAFVCSYLLFAPLCGYLGDRYNRKAIMAVGILVWSLAVLASSFVPDGHFWAFLACRALVGVGEASYSTISPTLIADLFAHDHRSRMLMLFYFAIPVGSGLGYMIGANVATATGDWRWGVRVTPPFGLLSALLIGTVLSEPLRGQSESDTLLVASSFSDDLRHLVSNRTYIWSTLGYTSVVFATGALSWWTPSAVIYSVAMTGAVPDTGSINLIFGAITCAAGLVGISAGSFWAQSWRRSNSKADPAVCAIGALSCVPFMYLSLNLLDVHLVVGWVIIFIDTALMAMNWVVVMDLLLYVVIPTRRATATAFQVTVSHLLGDAFSPYVIGLVSDRLRADASHAEHFYSLRFALYIPNFALLLGGYMFLCSAWFIDYDKMVAELETQGIKPVQSSDDDLSKPTGLRRRRQSKRRP